MKKIIPIILIIILAFNIKSENAIVIPKEALRFRVIANSNSKIDQQIKIQVKENLEKEIYSYLKDIDDLDEAKTILNNNMGLMKNTIDTTIKSNGNLYDYNINLGLNYFPQKEFKGVIYEEGEYESLVVQLGKGEGSNWWCVLFPPLCLLEATETEMEEVEYQFFVKKLIDKIFK